jgi:hypothetical protein
MRGNSELTGAMWERGFETVVLSDQRHWASLTQHSSRGCLVGQKVFLWVGQLACQRADHSVSRLVSL